MKINKASSFLHEILRIDRQFLLCCPRTCVLFVSVSVEFLFKKNEKEKKLKELWPTGALGHYLHMTWVCSTMLCVWFPSLALLRPHVRGHMCILWARLDKYGVVKFYGESLPMVKNFTFTIVWLSCKVNEMNHSH